MLSRTQHRFSVADYRRMVETGVLRPGARVELLDGRILDMSPTGPFHGGLVKRLSRLFHLAAKGRWIVATQDPLHLDEYSEPVPDIMLLHPAPDDYTSRHPEPGDVLLLIEVSDTTLNYDRQEKLPAYGRAGVTEVWIVNTEEQVVEVYRDPAFTGYNTRTVCRTGDSASPMVFPDVKVDVGELLRR